MNLPDNYEIIKDKKHILQKGDIYAMGGHFDWTPIIRSIGQPIGNYRGYTFARPIKNKVENLSKPAPVSYEEYQEITDMNQLCGNDTYCKEKGFVYDLLKGWEDRTVAFMKKNYPNLTFYKKNEKPRFPCSKGFPFGY